MGWMSRRRAVQAATCVVLGVLLASLAGCAAHMPWDDYVFEPVFRRAKQENRLTFVYLRNYFSIPCTRFEEQILTDPAVISATQGFRRVMIDESAAADRSTVALWGVENVPAVVIILPSGDKLSSLQGDISKEDLLRCVEDARQRFAALNAGGAPGR